ncbi:5,10-methylenetetrahydromethanopterin reductase [Parafrankia irregularis]|uniref:5,10-methylenetetrahydromethanopterin reductase n=1 Tax=Parafrankia irregularis TaxID=795642 RepID=A0A0S4QJY1_9ACTN|nr:MULTISPECIES: LLM class flavin-dependent oxidoreductase [Parafrankia]MBE3202107.1 LLM class flavin-dependent oxidoreductase [Parafrankia sp. CH37]CUU55889.1 5,10-methylenetetrahydromethanopterin reductase [Parafrankia irregularis]
MRSGVVLQGVDTPAVFESYVAEVERSGFDHLWLTDSSLHSRNPYAYLTLAARASSQLLLGTAVTNPLTRHPGITAVAAATVDEIAQGRFILGIGAGDRPLEAFGMRPAKLAVLEDSIVAIRALLRGGDVDQTSAGFELHDAHLRFGARSDIPVFISASGPKTLELAGRVADGVILLAGLHTDGIRFALEHIDRGVEAAGRSARPHVAVFAYGRIDEDEQAALAAARSIAAWFPQTAPVYCELAGLDRALIDEVRRRYTGGEFQEAGAAAELLPDEFVRRMALSGNQERTVAQLRELAAAGVDSVNVFPLGADRMGTVARFREAFDTAFGVRAEALAR